MHGAARVHYRIPTRFPVTMPPLLVAIFSAFEEAGVQVTCDPLDVLGLAILLKAERRDQGGHGWDGGSLRSDAHVSNVMGRGSEGALVRATNDGEGGF